MQRIYSLIFVLFVSCQIGFSQHEGHKMPAPKPAASPTPTPAPSPSPPPMEGEMPASHRQPTSTPSPMPEMKTPESNMEMKGATMPMPMEMGPLLLMQGDQMFVRVGNSSTNLLPMGQMGSGTSWQPASTAMNMLHKQSGEWLLMFHYAVFAGVNSQGGPRGVTKAEAANWFMGQAMHRLGKGTLDLKAMISFEPFTFPPGGSPLLFQTGETYQGRPLIDHQHPHDFFMELSSTYTLALGDKATWFAYFGYPGEPALGPTAFMHRTSASENPAAPLSHHLQDSSHISFGVFTSGFTYSRFKLEASVFNGREPDEHRYNFEAHPWNSHSARLSFAPGKNWSLQVSHGLLRNPEALEPGDVRRTTASLSYNKQFAGGNWAASLIWGRNHESHDGEVFNLNGYVAESTIKFLSKNYFYTRLELVDKNQLLRDADRQQLGITDPHPVFRIGAYTFGGARDFWTSEKITAALGGDLTFYSMPDKLNPIYGNHPTSFRVFIRLRPGQMSMSGAGHDHGMMKH